MAPMSALRFLWVGGDEGFEEFFLDGVADAVRRGEWAVRKARQGGDMLYLCGKEHGRMRMVLVWEPGMEPEGNEDSRKKD